VSGASFPGEQTSFKEDLVKSFVASPHAINYTGSASELYDLVEDIGQSLDEDGDGRIDPEKQELLDLTLEPGTRLDSDGDGEIDPEKRGLLDPDGDGNVGLKDMKNFEQTYGLAEP
jgi:hypothetical protein